MKNETTETKGISWKEYSVIYCNDCGGFRIASRQCGRPCGSNPHAVALGRLGGAAGKGATSERKSASSRANMQKAAQASAAKKRAKNEAANG